MNLFGFTAGFDRKDACRLHFIEERDSINAARIRSII